MPPNLDGNLESQVPDDHKTPRRPHGDRERRWTDFHRREQPESGVKGELESFLPWTSGLHPEIPASETPNLGPVHQERLSEIVKMLHSPHTPLRLVVDAHNFRRRLITRTRSNPPSRVPLAGSLGVADLEDLNSPSLACTGDCVTAITNTESRDATLQVKHGLALAPSSSAQLLAVPDTDGVVC